MESEKRLPLAVTASSGTAGVSPPVSVLPETRVEEGEAGSPNDASSLKSIGHLEGARFRSTAHFDAADQTLLTPLCEAFRANFEDAAQFLSDAVTVKGPFELVALQLLFTSRQLANVAQQTIEFQREWMKLYPRG